MRSIRRHGPTRPRRTLRPGGEEIVLIDCGGNPGIGAVEGFGYVWLQLELARSGERATLTLGAHVGNAP